ncbi:MAG: hypothetical protein QOG54_1039 [Actinomycetota bacterium]|jgi:hypothetical protein|nr:hypothetical protein [Actinomycetota bacterium]
MAQRDIAQGNDLSRTDELPRELIEDLVEQLRGRLEPIIKKLIASYRARIQSYAAAPPEFLDEVHIGTTASFQVGLAILAGDVDAAAIREPLVEVGRRRAEQGIPLGDALFAWQISAHAFWDNIAEIAPADPELRAAVLGRATHVIMELLEHAVSAVSAGYLEVEQARVADEEYELQTIVEVLAGVRTSDRSFDRVAKRRGLDVESLCCCYVTIAPDSEVGGLVRELRAAWPAAVVGRIGAKIVAFATDDRMPPRAGGTGLARDPDPATAYRRALAAARAAVHLGLPNARYEEVAPLAMILDAPDDERRGFIDAQIGELLADPLGEELAKTLRAYYDAGQSVASAARALHVHRHTLEYRLERAQKLLGVDPRDPARRLFIELALSLNERSPSRGSPGTSR